MVVVWKLDRLSRSLKDLLHLMERIEEKGAGFRSLTEAVDTTTAAGRMLMQMVGAFAEFERSMIRERTRAGLESARANGRTGGRPRKLSAHQRETAVELIDSGTKSAADVARLFRVHPSTISREVARHRHESPGVQFLGDMRELPPRARNARAGLTHAQASRVPGSPAFPAATPRFARSRGC